jgi:CheY-like chemotaxis protein
MTAPAAKRRILLVDDDVAFTLMLKDFLTTRADQQWEVETAAHYTTALACLKKSPFDLAVLDFHMPVMDGLQFQGLVRRAYPNLPVVILTGYATEENRAYALKNGAALFLDKAAVAGGFEAIYAALDSIVSNAPASDGFRGMLRQVGLSDVLQMECLGRKSSLLEVRAGRTLGRIYICDGSIQHAECENLLGEPALFHVLGLQGGEFQLKPFAAPSRRTIDGNWESLLMEAARQHDEAQSEVAALHEPPPAPEPAPLLNPETPASPLAPAPDAIAQANWTIEEILLCSGEGEILYEWKTAGIDRRMRLLSLLSSQADWLGRALPLGRADRLEISALTQRAAALLQPDRRVFVRSAVASGQPPA